MMVICLPSALDGVPAPKLYVYMRDFGLGTLARQSGTVGIGDCKISM